MSIQMLNLSIQLAGLVLCLLAILQILVGPKVHGKADLYFMALFSCLFLYDANNLLGQIYRGKEGFGWRVVLNLLNLLEFVTAILLLYVMSLYLLYMAKRNKERRIRKIITALFVGQLVLLFLSQIFGFIYYIDPANMYRRGPWYLIAYFFPLLMMLLDIYLLFSPSSSLTKKERFAFGMCLLFPLSATLLQPLIYGIYLVVFAAVVSALILYIFLRMEETERYYAQAAENANLKINIMLSQIQPHFIYNSLYVIQQLCATDAQAAGNAIGNFTQYLRHNMDSITIDTPIPFEEEIGHVRCYVQLQQLRFGDYLQVDYDLGCTDFCLPTLTLQPIVENAVRYGVRKTPGGKGTVHITTREKPDCYEITVKDDGPGFVPETLAGEQERARVGLKNVKERLERICQGELRIDTILGQGTTATLIIPKKTNQEGSEEEKRGFLRFW